LEFLCGILVYRWITFVSWLTIGVASAWDRPVSIGMLAMQSGKAEWTRHLTNLQKLLVGYLGRMECGCWDKDSSGGRYLALTQQM
jgi:hypothetical protein